MKVSYKKFSSFFWQLLVAAILFVVSLAFAHSSKEAQIRVVAVTALFILLQSFFMVWKLNRRINCYCILLLLVGVFMFGQHLLFLLNIAPDDMMLLRNKISQAGIYQTGFLVLYGITAMNIGYLITADASFVQEKVELTETSEVQRRRLFSAGQLFFLLSVVPTIIVLSRNIILTFTIGYGERMLDTAYRVSGVRNIAGILSAFMVPSLIAMFVGRTPGQKFPIVAIAVYMVLYTLSGSRINTFILLIGTMYVQNTLFSKLNFKKLLKYALYALAILLVLSTVSVARMSIGSTDGDSRSIFKDSVTQVLENNVVVSSVAEAGYTFSATAVIVDRCPSEVPYKKGMSYVRALAYLLPNGMTGNLYARVGSADDVFKGYLNQYGSGIGSSYIAEAYWNFGYASLLLLFAFGLLLGKLTKGLDRAIQQRDYIRIFLFTYMFITVSFYVRSETSTFFRNIVWFGLPIVLVAKHVQMHWRGMRRSH